MKIKLQDYSLISNEWIDSKIKKLITQRDRYLNDELWENAQYKQGEIHTLKSIKEQLIPAEKLADVSWEAAKHEPSGLGIYDEKEEFLNSEIEIQ